MTDPERISTRSSGLAAQLLQAGRAECPSSANLEKALVALGVSGAALTAAQAAGAQLSGTASTTAGAVAAASGAASGTAAKIASTALLAKWIGIGLVGGIGVAAVALRPSTLGGPTAASGRSARPSSKAAAAAVQSVRSARSADPPEQAPPVTPSMPRPTPVARRPDGSGEPQPTAHAAETETLLAAEVAFVDRARAAFSAGQSQRSFALLQDYEQTFPEARLLPEVLFLRLESCERSGRHAEARAVARRLVTTFAHSPHAARARSLLASP